MGEYDGESGLSEARFQAEQRRRRKDVRRYEGEIRQNPERLYFIFADRAQQERALKLVEEYRQTEDAFTYLTNWKPNFERRPDVGVELDFSRQSEGLEEKVKRFFLNHRLELREKLYKVSEMPGSGGGKREVAEERDIAA